MNCPKCSSAMELGFIADVTHGGVVAPRWYSGRLEWSFWGGLRLRKRACLYVQTMRCTQCGYLESYAR